MEQLLGILDQIDLNVLGIQMKFRDELKRHNKFQRTLLGLSNPAATHQDIDLRMYAKYLLKEGTNEEKRQLMGCLKSKLKITEGFVTIDQ